MRCAVVAPTLPAPTTVILFTILGVYSVNSCRRKLSATQTGSNRTRLVLSRQLVTGRANHRRAFAAVDVLAAWSPARCGRKARAEVLRVVVSEDRPPHRRTDKSAVVRPP